MCYCIYIPFPSVRFRFFPGIQPKRLPFDTEDGIFFIVTIVATALLNFTRLNLLPTIGSAVMVFFLCLEVNKLERCRFSCKLRTGPRILIIGTILMIGGSIGAIVLNILERNHFKRANQKKLLQATEYQPLAAVFICIIIFCF